jgi:hypothetical protein
VGVESAEYKASLVKRRRMHGWASNLQNTKRRWLNEEECIGGRRIYETRPTNTFLEYKIRDMQKPVLIKELQGRINFRKIAK